MGGLFLTKFLIHVNDNANFPTLLDSRHDQHSFMNRSISLFQVVKDSLQTVLLDDQLLFTEPQLIGSWRFNVMWNTISSIVFLQTEYKF